MRLLAVKNYLQTWIWTSLHYDQPAPWQQDLWGIDPGSACQPAHQSESLNTFEQSYLHESDFRLPKYQS